MKASCKRLVCIAPFKCAGCLFFVCWRPCDVLAVLYSTEQDAIGNIECLLLYMLVLSGAFFLFLFSSFFFASEFAIVFFMITLNGTYLCFMVVLCAVLKCAVRSRNSDLHFMYMYTLLTTF